MRVSQDRKELLHAVAVCVLAQRPGLPCRGNRAPLLVVLEVVGDTFDEFVSSRALVSPPASTQPHSWEPVGAAPPARGRPDFYLTWFLIKDQL